MSGYYCSACGEFHDELPLAFDAAVPFAYSEVPEPELAARTLLSSDQCVVDSQRFFVRGQLELPIIAHPNVFTWGIWVEVSEQDFDRMSELWETVGREAEPPYAATVGTVLRVYAQSTLGLRAHLHTRPVGLRPTVALVEHGHALATEQRHGVTLERVRSIAAAVMHGSS